MEEGGELGHSDSGFSGQSFDILSGRAGVGVILPSHAHLGRSGLAATYCRTVTLPAVGEITCS